MAEARGITAHFSNLDGLDWDDVLIVDLNGITRMEHSFIDQAFVSPMKLMLEENDNGHYKAICFRVPNAVIEFALDRALYAHGLLALVNLGDTMGIIGSVGRSVTDTFYKILAMGEVSSDALPGLIGESEQITDRRMERLVTAGVIEETGRDGKRFYSTRLGKR